jgi:hypothetical protein
LSNQLKQAPKSARVRYIKAAAKEQWQTLWNKTTTALRRITKGKYIRKDRPDAIQQDRKEKRSSGNCTTKDWTLWVKSIPPPIQHQGLTILRMRVWKRDSGTLSVRMSKVQGTKEDAKKQSGKQKDANGNTIRRSGDDETHAGIHHRYRKTERMK